MIDQIAKLFRICYPGIVRSEDSVRHTISHEENNILTRFDGDTLIGAAVYYEDRVLMLCVHPEYRGRGIGSELLAECETAIRGAGYLSAGLEGGLGFLVRHFRTLAVGFFGEMWYVSLVFDGVLATLCQVIAVMLPPIPLILSTPVRTQPSCKASESPTETQEIP